MSEKIQLNLIPFHQIIYSPQEGRIHLIESMQFTNLAAVDKIGVMRSMSELFNRKMLEIESHAKVDMAAAREAMIKEKND